SALEQQQPDGVLVRHWGALERFRDTTRRPWLHGDFSLNVTNSLTAAHLLESGLDTITASHDLDAPRLMRLAENTEAGRLVVVVQHRIATFHTEHCVYAHLLSEGRDHLSCGRPCEIHEVALRDHQGRDHPVIVDAGCRNTVFNRERQTGARLVPDLIDRGVRRFRVEFVRETRAEARRSLESWQALLNGAISAETLEQRLGTVDRIGVL
ncbi:MAG: U32 family peptidase, partial [Planctomycetes bacterium]|nr:U32 family peptidase [Planctomycetota bacterium]